MISVSDSASHRRDQIANFAEILRNAPARQKIFTAVYFGKQRVKTINEIAETTGYSTKRVAILARPLARGEKLFEQGRETISKRVYTVYKKIDFVAANKNQIISLAKNRKKLNTYNTKTNPKSTILTTQKIVIRLPFKISTKFIRTEDIKEFSKVRTIRKNVPLKPARLSEVATKRGIIKLLGERRVPKDWGGETDDIFTTKLTLLRQKYRAAFALKGPAKTGPLVPKMMGKNGDQIQRLFNAPAEVFIVQYEGEVKESIFKLMEELAKARAISGGRIYWGIIDDEATKKLRTAYPKAFRG